MRKPMILVFAGPNGSGKSTITNFVSIIGQYVNADEMVKDLGISNMDAAIKATQMREDLIAQKKDFTFETVLSSDRNLKLLQKAKDQGYFIKCIYVLTDNDSINVQRVRARVSQGGHNVEENTIRTRYHKCMKLIPELVNIVDIIHIYDNTTEEPIRIFKKKKTTYACWESEHWDYNRIATLTTKKES